mmetsp:Transcript_86921/g.243580  ORF Transcript_86921/g.243580 Transcript_86921/m.243580 type:complete len:320 (-) Transcript_86921:117-1076(-)|eukprot:CAMPEP_0117548596 /NCGR_PEP_ID=MMETSP0784-20121206/47731_1 /TAXON_ID=39447 /ORGANISM="" /LENGTH=319 /DNA_ID=CAMNT_0005345557 /DNA_START=30 /DNA_END=989 /DNA_ORIENTATION=-
MQRGATQGRTIGTVGIGAVGIAVTAMWCYERRRQQRKSSNVHSCGAQHHCRRQDLRRISDAAPMAAPSAQASLRRPSQCHLSDALELFAFAREALSCHLAPEDAARLRRASRGLVQLFSPNSCVLNASLLNEPCAAKRAPGLSDVLYSNSNPSRCDVVNAAFADALRLGGDLARALAAKDAQGRSPMLVALQRGWHEALSVLLKLEAPVDCGDAASGWSPLMFAATTADRDTAALLLSHGASVNFLARPHGWTPLLAAVAAGHEDLVGWLLDRGADLPQTVSILRANFSHFAGQLEALQRIVRQREEFGKAVPMHEYQL